MKRIDRFLARPLALVVVCSLWMATVGNVPLWREFGELAFFDDASGWALAGALALVIAAVLVALLSLLAWRGWLKPAMWLLLFASAIGVHFMLQYHVVIDSGMLLNALQSDRRESADLLGPGLAFSAIWGAALPAWLVWRTPLDLTFDRQRIFRNVASALAALLLGTVVVMACFQPLASAMRNHKQLRYLMNPLNTVYAVGQLAVKPLRRDARRLEPLGRDARLGATGQRPPLLVLVLGETARAGNFGLNGYPRNTTPELAAVGVASFRDVESCGTSTAASVPCMFSHLGRERFAARDAEHENLLDVLQHAGLAVLWVDNQGGCKGVCDRISQASTVGETDADLCRDGECQDEILLRRLDARIAALPAAARERGVVVVLHPMGSHGPAYSRRSPAGFKRFQPECVSNRLTDCDRAAIVNAYDNSIAYVDHLLSSTIGWLRERSAGFDTAMLYVADHGESLGENNLYLHGLPRAIAPRVQLQVPWVSWFSPAFEQRTGIASDCLQHRRDVRLSHDHYFHSVLGVLDVRTTVYDSSLDAYAACRPQ
ncbi:phosphoethanolamine transferase [Ramlibacter sp.]|uniref:phosphoethanolamine transferase n=1 Tax=Ramlibacter sp. TaxID=1917967 RepID=UPI003D14CD0B